MSSALTVFSLCLLVLQSQGLPSGEALDDYYSADDYSSDDYNYSNDNDDYLNKNEQVVLTTPTLISTSSNQLVNEGDTIKLPCLVDKLDGFTILWKKGNDVVAVGSQLMDRDDARVKLEEKANGNTLVISLAEPSDAGEYVCRISSSKMIELKHSVRIRVAPVIRPVPPSGRLVVYQGKPATLSCDILKGNPTPEITWRRKERKMPSGEDEVRGLSITFTPTSRTDSGIYTCYADNGFGRPSNATIILDVQHPPEVKQEQTFIHTDKNDETEVTCIVHASPRAEVIWLKNGVQLQRDQGQAIFKDRGNRHSLLLLGIKESSFGTYKCKATNKFGSDERTTEVSGKAREVNFKSDPHGSLETSHELEWVAESKTPISKFKLQFKEEKDSYFTANEIRDEDSSWTEVLVSPQNNGDNFYSGQQLIPQLSPATRYLARVSSRNDYGYSKFSQPFTFATKGAALKPQPQPSSTDGGSATISSFSIAVMLSLAICSQRLSSTP